MNKLLFFIFSKRIKAKQEKELKICRNCVLYEQSNKDICEGCKYIIYNSKINNLDPKK